MAFNIFTELCSHQHHHFRTFSSHQQEPSYPWPVTSYFPQPPGLRQIVIYPLSPYRFAYAAVNHKWTLSKGARHLPVWRLNPALRQLLTFNTPGREFREENEALCSRETGGTGLQIVRYFQELVSRSQFLHLLMSRKALNPFLMTSAPCD